MTASTSRRTPWFQAEKAPFEGFGILYYPLFKRHADIACDRLDDADMAWAVTANANLDGTGYTLSQPAIMTLAAYHRIMTGAASGSPLMPLRNSLDGGGINPLEDIKRLVPDVTAAPMYPDFPKQVMEIDEAEYRYHQMLHYFSTYGVEQLAGLRGIEVTVGAGWLPDLESTPKERADDTLVAPKTLHVILSAEDLHSVIAARFTRATRMHPAEIATALLVFDDLGDEGAEEPAPAIAFHENMLELIRVAGEGSSSRLERMARRLAQHPGDLLKATMHLAEANPKHHLASRQKKALCRAFEKYPVMDIARNIADAGRSVRQAYNYLSVARFGGERLREAIRLVDTGEVRSWVSELEQLWTVVGIAKAVDAHSKSGFEGYFAQLGAERPEPSEASMAAWRALFAHYGQRPGMLFRSLARLAKSGCPEDLLVAEAKRHAESYAIPTIVSTLTAMSEGDVSFRVAKKGYAEFDIVAKTFGEKDRAARRFLLPLLREILIERLAAKETPLRGKRVFLDAAGVSLKGSVLVPNEVGDTGTAWPQAGLAWNLPEDKTIRFFTFWDDREKRVDVDLHFIGRSVDGEEVHIGWNADFRGSGMATSGDITHSENAVEFLDADMAAACKEGVQFVVQQQHIYAGAERWDEIDSCYSGAIVVGDTSPDVRLADPANIIFRDDLTGRGSELAYAAVNFPSHYVRLLRGANIPIGVIDFSLGDYLEALFTAQGARLVGEPEEADIRVCVGRSDESGVISLFDEGFFVG